MVQGRLSAPAHRARDRTLREHYEAMCGKGIAFATQPIFIYAEIESWCEEPRDASPVRCLSYCGHAKYKNSLLLFQRCPGHVLGDTSDPFPGIKGAVTRKAYDGTDCGERHKVDIETALRLYTKSAAEVVGFHNLGQLKEGYQGDFVILSEDILEIPSEKIDQVKADETSWEKKYMKEKKRGHHHEEQ